MKKIAYLLIAVSVFAVLGACSDDHDNPSVSDETVQRNEWIQSNMSADYLWNDELPTNLNEKTEPDSKNYFYQLLSAEDHWSSITDDYTSLLAELDGTPMTMGYDPSFYQFYNSDEVYMVVNYVYPNSPADEGGLKRGDIILTIDGEAMDTTNYYSLYTGDSYTVGLGELSGNTISDSGKAISLTNAVVNADPAIYSTVIDKGTHKIGYLAYVEFVTGTNDQFLSTLDNIFAGFRSQGITDLVVDLRYNPGGDIDAATYLASEIAPAANVSSEDVLVNMSYNDDLQSYFEGNTLTYGDELSFHFTKDVTGNNDLKSVYFLTTGGTASASELLMTGLDPYMTETRIGESTYGKYVGAWVLPDQNDENWAMMPIVMKYSNINGFTDFVNGLEPDDAMTDDVINAAPLGDLSDPMLAEAVNLITGESRQVRTRKIDLQIHSRKIFPRGQDIHRNLFLNSPVSVNY